MNKLNKVRFCFRLRDAGVDADGRPCPLGMCVTLGDTEKEVDYEKLVDGLNTQALMTSLGLGSISVDKLDVITPEEYDREYGEANDEN